MKDSMLKAVVPVAVVLVLGFGLGLYLNQRAARVSQPLDFPHSKHLALGVRCEACHTGVRDTPHAGIPSIKICANCHVPGRAMPPTPPFLAAHIISGRAIDWKQVTRVPSFVLFSHRRHVSLGGLDCRECHGDVAAKTHAFARPYFMTKMSVCVDCHRKMGASTDCLACHK